MTKRIVAKDLPKIAESLGLVVNHYEYAPGFEAHKDTIGAESISVIWGSGAYAGCRDGSDTTRTVEIWYNTDEPKGWVPCGKVSRILRKIARQ